MYLLNTKNKLQINALWTISKIIGNSFVAKYLYWMFAFQI